MRSAIKTLAGALFLGLLLILGLNVAAFQGGSVTITPPTGSVGTTFDATVSGLTPGQTYTLELTFVADNSLIFSTTRPATGDGTLTLPLVTSDSDPSGTYRLTVIDGSGTPVANGTFELTGGAPQRQTTPPPGTGTATVRVIPNSAPLGGVYDVLVSGLEPTQTVMVVVTLDETGEEVFSRRRTADEQGRFDIELFSTADDTPGIYIITVQDMDDTTLGSGSFIIEAPVGQNAVVSVTPERGEAGTQFTITASELKPFADLRVRVTTTSGSETLFDTRIRATVDGTIDVTFDSSTTSLIAGEYAVIIEEGDTVVGESSVTLLSSSPDQQVSPTDVNISVQPSSGPRGTDFTVDVTGLVPNSAFTFEVVLDGEDTPTYTTERVADADGSFSITLGTNDTDNTGSYSLNIVQNGTLIVQGSLDLTGVADSEQTPPQAASAVNVVIVPARGAPGTQHIVTVSGLNANETVVIDVLYAGDVVFETQRTSDINGVALITLATDETDQPGNYTVRVMRAGIMLAQSDLTILGDDVVQGESDDTETQPETQPDEQAQPPADAVSVVVEPQTGPIGTAYTITVDGLNANETVTINVLRENSVVFGTERTADSTGMARIIITSEEGDPPGPYSVEIVRDGVAIASANFAVGEGEVPAPDTAQPPTQPEPPATGETTVTITPDAGPRETVHQITVSGLTPGETVTLDVLFRGQNVFTTERTADADGAVTLSLQSEPGDPVGDYTVQVTRQGAVVADATLTIQGEEPEDSETAPPPPAVADVSVQITPPVGPVGTSHQVVVSGLQPRETVTLNVLYNGQVDYTTERTADATGNVALRLIAAEGDPTGEYTVEVLRGADRIASGVLTVQPTDTAQQPEPPVEQATPAPQEPQDTTPPDPAATDTLVDRPSDVLTETAPSITYSIQGTAGDLIYITMSSPEIDTYLSLNDNMGNTLVSNDDTSGTDSAIGPFPLPYTGVYTIVASTYNFVVMGEPTGGGFNLLASSVTPQTLTPGTVQADFSPASQRQIYSIDAQIGDVLGLAVENSTLDTQMRLIAPDGAEVAFDDDGGAGFDPEIPRYVVVDGGRYLLVVEPATAANQGTANLTLNVDGGRVLNGTAEQIRLDSKATADVLRLEGSAGRDIELNLSVVSGNVNDLTIIVTQDGQPLMDYTARAIPDTLSIGFTIPEDGTVAILFESFGSTAIIDVTTAP